MGRYYSGDIEGKFWFGVQSSTAADRFGVQYTEPDYVQYCYSKEDLPKVEKEIDNILNILGENKQKLDDFFNSCFAYNENLLKEHGLLEIWETHKRDYADLELGIKIRDCLLEQDYCEFECEL